MTDGRGSRRCDDGWCPTNGDRFPPCLPPSPPPSIIPADMPPPLLPPPRPGDGGSARRARGCATDTRPCGGGRRFARPFRTPDTGTLGATSPLSPGPYPPWELLFICGGRNPYGEGLPYPRDECGCW